MADVTISQLGTGTPTTGIVVPWSDGTTTYQAKLSSLITAQGDMGTGAFKVPVGTTAQRPQSTATGMIRYNTTTSSLEFYNGSIWINIVGTYTAEILIVAGGGGGGLCFGGGGGAGGLIYNANYVLTSGTVVPITVGSGGTNRSNSSGNGGPGGNSSFGSLIAVGGGFGAGNCGNTGGNGGSGGGGSSTGGGLYLGGTGTSGQGNNGGQSPTNEGGGGGGAGAFAVNQQRKGGDGLQYSITGVSRYYAGGGSGAGSGSVSGGLGGGGTGGYAMASGVGNAIANTGGGGGGSIIAGGSGTSGIGGSGIVIVRYQGSQRASGGNNIYSITVSGISYTVHEFTSEGSSTLAG